MIKNVSRVPMRWCLVGVLFVMAQTISARKDVWRAVQKKSQDAVVQVVAQVAEFDWLQPYKTPQESESRGSGFFINDQGELITNAHVVSQAKRVWIHIPSLGKKNLHVDIVSIAPEYDLALLRLKKQDLAYVRKELATISWLPLGNSDTVRRTDDVLVLGYPLGQERLKSATGIVSGREFLNGQSYIQVTAPVNDGSSGGPLLNTDGDVIGINTAGISLAQNVGYSIPIHILKVMLDDLHKKELIRRPLFGVSFNPANNALVKFLGNPEPGGLYVNKVYKDTLADKAGLREGDMIYTFNGYQLDVYGDATVDWNSDKVSINDLLSRLALGQTVAMAIYRHGEKKELSFVFGDLTLYPIRYQYPNYETIDYEIIGGMVIMQLADNHLSLLLDEEPQLVIYQKLENKVDPVLIIAHILSGSVVQQLRSLSAGNRIKEVNGVKVKTLSALRDALEKGVETDSLQVKTVDNVFVALSLQDVLKDEQRLAKDFSYPISKTVQALREKIMGRSDEKKA